MNMEYVKQPMHMRLDKANPKHLRNILAKLINIYGNQCGAPNDKDAIAGWIQSQTSPILCYNIRCYTAEQIDYADERVKEFYSATNQKVQTFKRGRPFGSKNRDKNYSTNNDDQSFDVMSELSSLDTSPKLPDPVPTQTTVLDNETIRKIIAEQIVPFIQAYDKDIDLIKQDIAKQLSDGLNKIYELKPNLIEIKRGEDLPNISLGIQHKNFEKLLKVCSAKLRNGQRNNVWLYGPAGTGKSTAAEKVAEALSLKFHCDGKLADKAELLGYRDAMSNYASTNFRKAFEHGGIYLADEIDGWMPDALLALNGALANGICAFPDKVIKRHDDFIMIAAANTTGQGGTIEYVGRYKQDASSTDRFVFLDWPIDDALEDSLVANKEWLARVRHVRAKVISSGIKGHLITPRASLYGESLLASGLDQKDVEAMTLRKGLTDQQWMQVS